MNQEKKYETYSRNLDKNIKKLQNSRSGEERSVNRTRVGQTIFDEATEMAQYAIRRAEKIAG